MSLSFHSRRLPSGPAGVEVKQLIRVGDSEMISDPNVPDDTYLASLPKWGRRFFWSDGTETYVIHDTIEESIRYMRALKGGVT